MPTYRVFLHVSDQEMVEVQACSQEAAENLARIEMKTRYVHWGVDCIEKVEP
jgi:hypothetical protein